MKVRMPIEILVYVSEYDSRGNPIFGVVENVKDIPEDCDGEKIGNYVLNGGYTFKIKRHLYTDE